MVLLMAECRPISLFFDCFYDTEEQLFRMTIEGKKYWVKPHRFGVAAHLRRGQKMLSFPGGVLAIATPIEMGPEYAKGEDENG